MNDHNRILSHLLQNDRLPNLPIDALTLDSRKVKSGSLFFAYPGGSQDGRNFIEQAIAQGASAIIFENGDGFNFEKVTSTPLIPMTGVRANIGLIAAQFYEHPTHHLNMIGVTGTNGKTSVTHFIAQSFAAQEIHCAVIGTLGNGLLPTLSKLQLTTPNPIELQWQLSEFQSKSVTHVAMEVSSHALDQSRVAGIEFDTAVFTQLSRDHLDYHGDLTSYARAKELLFQMPGLKNAIINFDDEFGRAFIEKYHQPLNMTVYSLNPIADTHGSYIFVRRITALESGFQVELESSWGRGQFQINMLGRFNISNVLAMLGVMLNNDVPLRKALTFCPSLCSVKGRMQTFGDLTQPKVVIDYAHTPDALEKALTTLRTHCQGRLWCVFGCGGNRDRGKRPQMAEVAEKFSDYIIITDDNPRNEPSLEIAKDIQAGFRNLKNVKFVLNRAEAIQTVVQSAKINDIVLIAGKGHETSQTIGAKILPFDDAEHVMKALSKR